jgi:hypothetical protein
MHGTAQIVAGMVADAGQMVQTQVVIDAYSWVMHRDRYVLLCLNTYILNTLIVFRACATDGGTMSQHLPHSRDHGNLGCVR